MSIIILFPNPDLISMDLLIAFPHLYRVLNYMELYLLLKTLSVFFSLNFLVTHYNTETHRTSGLIIISQFDSILENLTLTSRIPFYPMCI